MKSAALPIRCGDRDLTTILQPLGMPIKTFPIIYLGMPLSLCALRKVDLEPLLDKFDGKLATWKGELMPKGGRLILLKLVLSALVVYLIMVHRLLAWIMQRIIKRCLAWLWRGKGTCNGGQWLRTCWYGAASSRKEVTMPLLLLTSWEIWRERNKRTFERQQLTTAGFRRILSDEITMWNRAGASFPFDPG